MICYLDPLQISRAPYPYYPRVVQEGDNIQVCLQTNTKVVTESVYIHVQTTHTTENTPPAIGKTDI